jgi:hypothetical protein
VLSLFPLQGRKVDVPLSTDLGKHGVVEFVNGRVLFVQSTVPRVDGSLLKIEFNPLRQTVVPGSTGFGVIWHVTVSNSSGRIYVSGYSNSLGPYQCGSFEIDPTAGTSRTLRSGTSPGCGGAGGPVSPDGKKAVGYKGKELGIVDLQTGAVQAVNGVSAGNLPDFGSWTSDGSWSPDGKWLAAVSGGKVILIDAMNPSHHRSLGAAGDAGLVWSPDSKYLLLQRSQLSCGLLSMSESLEALEVGTGKRTMIKSSHCEVYAGWHGWVDPAAVQ